MTHAVAARYLDVYKKELSQDAMDQVPGASNTDFGQWREKSHRDFRIHEYVDHG